MPFSKPHVMASALFLAIPGHLFYPPVLRGRDGPFRPQADEDLSVLYWSPVALLVIQVYGFATESFINKNRITDDRWQRNHYTDEYKLQRAGR